MNRNYTVKYQQTVEKFCPTSEPELARTQTGMTIHEARREAKRLNDEAATKAADPLAGLSELRSAQNAAYNEEQRYQDAFDGMMETGVFEPLDEQPRQTYAALARQYPRAAMYMRAQDYTLSSNVHKYSAGKRAMDLIAAGGSLGEARSVLDNWLPESAIWD